jgi:hypothetical protein
MNNQNSFYGEEKTIEIMQEQKKGWLFYVSHNTPELLEEYHEYCEDNNLDKEKEESASAFMDYREKLFEEALENDF